MLNSQLLELFKILNSGILWLYFIIVVVVFYGIIALLTWNIKKPLIFLGIPSIIVGTFLVIFKFCIGLFISNQSLLTIITSATKPLLIIGIICVVMGIGMIIVYKVLNKQKKNNQDIQKI